jgi:hypothetical protein
LDNVLSVYLGYGEREQSVLYTAILWRVSIEDRFKILTELLEQDGLIDQYPYLQPFPKILSLRNICAHHLLDVMESTDEMLIFIGRRRGDEKHHEVSMRRLKDVAYAISHVSIDLKRLRDYLTNLRGVDAPAPDPQS